MFAVLLGRVPNGCLCIESCFGPKLSRFVLQTLVLHLQLRVRLLRWGRKNGFLQFSLHVGEFRFVKQRVGMSL